MDEIFGERDRIGIIVWKQMADNNPTRVSVGHEYVMCYAKRIESVPAVWEGHSAAKSWMLQTYERLKALDRGPGQLETDFQEALTNHIASFKRAAKAGEPPDLVDLGPLGRYKFVDDRGPYAAVRDTAVHQGAASRGYKYDIIHPVTHRVCKKPGSG